MSNYERLVIHMEKKTSNKSINKLIYSLMAAMLAVVVIVSVFTVSTRRGNEGADTSSDNAAQTSDSTTADTGKNPPESGGTDTNKQGGDTKKPADTGDTTPPDTKSKPTADTEDISASKELRYFVMPTVGTVAKDFEIEIPVYSLTMNDYRAHTGVDINAQLGSDVVAASNGTVCKVWNDPLMGSCIMLDHGDNIYTTYMNLSKEPATTLEVGQKVSMGQSIGAVGESALVEIAEEPHLHLEMKVDGKYVDPLEYMGISSEQDISYEE